MTPYSKAEFIYANIAKQILPINGNTEESIRNLINKALIDLEPKKAWRAGTQPSK